MSQASAFQSEIDSLSANLYVIHCSTCYAAIKALLAILHTAWKLRRLVSCLLAASEFLRVRAIVKHYIIALFFYDYISTVAQEYKTIWKRPLSAATVIFCTTRYLTLINRGVRMIQLMNWRGHMESQADYVCIDVTFYCAVRSLILAFRSKSYRCHTTFELSAICSVPYRISYYISCTVTWRLSQVCSCGLYLSLSGMLLRLM